MRDNAVEFGAEFCALGWVGNAGFVGFKARFAGEIVEFRGGADEAGSAGDYLGEPFVILGKAGDGDIVNNKEITMCGNSKP